MAGDKISYTVQAAQTLVQNLGARDTLSVVLYNDHVETLLPPENVKRKDVINQRIARIKTGGTTNLSSGWLEGCNFVAQNLDNLGVNRVILMSDGLANRGVTESDVLVKMTGQKLEEGVSTTTMGLGDDFNEDLLMAMADAGGGSFYFIESPEVAPMIFKEELQGLLSVIGQNLTVSFEPTDPEITVNQLNAYPDDMNGNIFSYRLGDIFGDEIKALLLEVTIPPYAETGQRQIALLRFEYDELIEQGSQHHVIELPVMIQIRETSDAPILANSDVQQSVLLLHAANARKEAVSAADAGDFNTAGMMLRTAADAIAQSELDDPKLRDEHDSLLQQASDIEQGESGYRKRSRKMISTQAHYTMHSRHEDTMQLRVRDLEQRRKPDYLPEDPEYIEKREGVVPTLLTWNEQNFPLVGDLIRIGRSKHNEIRIDVDGVSRFHCQLIRKDGQLLLEDLGSTNGTLIAGAEIKEPYPLSVGDVAYLSDERLVFHDGSFME
jgi:Ca-activated chloride channel family protein